ncbi:MAG: DUF1761 domain-containing protein [Micromonosporaceae bacterium]
MSFAVLGDVNWLAVIVAAVAYFGLGGLWFARFAFGDIWSRAIGWDTSGEQAPGPEYYIGPAVTCLLSTIAVAMLAVATGTDTFAEGIVLGLVTGLGISGAVLFVTGYFDPKKPQPMLWTAITLGYHLLGLLIVSVILALWR